MSQDIEVPLGSVKRGPRLGAGGQGDVHPVLAVAGASPAVPLVVKLFHRPSEVMTGPLADLIEWRRALDDNERALLDTSTAWPRLLVVNRGQTLGLVMPLVPDVFVDEVTLPSGPTRRVLRELQFLLASDELLRRRGLDPPSWLDRLAVLAAGARLVALLHAHGLVVGDLSAKNGLWAASGGRGEFHLLDCDGVRRIGATAATVQANSPMWEDPAFPGSQNQQSDVYKFGLLVLRAATSSFQARDVGSLDTVQSDLLGPQVRALLRASLSGDPDVRPRMQAWADVLVTRVKGPNT